MPTDSTDILPYAKRGVVDQHPPLVLLHGFGGSAAGWTNLQIALERRRRSIAFDLPGHGRALGAAKIGNAHVSMLAVMASMDALGLDRVHLVGHSMGGAVAALLALKAPERLASLTLLSPGGFGREINHVLLRAYGRARDLEALAPLVPQFFGPAFRLPRRMVENEARERAEPGRVETLVDICESILDGNMQKMLPREALGDLKVPVKVIWGFADRVLPVSQSAGLPGMVALHRFAGVGHMPHLEVPREVARLIAHQITLEDVG
ncbi:Dihydrolipoyllysine-residue acetyltransferase component of acetoin cleaving system [Hartmannibacter diazotrophicus]|uniref:Dihydrolipoyllysine-residue acetyltransferase component of acetoin cleaving system n=1 Tax=Hartmannibacter diazotrophicus TaxID=1482074 RepID=A0A2C9DB61_9HYPH|nr:alpha/beta fold hydrolase [Hartmannibacter diazotrophicus]SON57496.1 Dihydrolipoyllysine-residue acetyltransferase component of acetoin cleaving system [Hartmannibacter diazotrophicus]